MITNHGAWAHYTVNDRYAVGTTITGTINDRCTTGFTINDRYAMVTNFPGRQVHPRHYHK